MNEVILTMVGNVIAEPELGQTRSGVANAWFPLASTTRRYDRQMRDYVNGETVYIDVRCWRGLARQAAQVLTKGAPVIVHGRLRPRSGPAGSDGRPSTRDAMLLEAFSVGLDLARLPLVDADPAGLPLSNGPLGKESAA